MARALVPKGCIIHRISLVRGGAEIAYRCGNETGEAKYPLPRGEKGYGTYPTKFVRGITSIDHRGAHIYGTPLDVSFTLLPARASCRKAGPTNISCTMKGDTSLPALRGLGRGKKRRRRTSR